MGQNLDYLSTNQPTDEYTHKLQHRVLEMRDDKEWRENIYEKKIIKIISRVSIFDDIMQCKHDMFLLD